MRKLIDALVVAVMVAYWIGEAQISTLLITAGVYLIIGAIESSAGFKIAILKYKIQRDRNIEIWRIKRAHNKQLKNDKKKVKDILDKKIK